MAVRKLVASLATLGSGGSGGLEASSALIGENLGAWYYRLRSNKVLAKPESTPGSRALPWVAPNPDYLQAAQLSGIAAGVTALLGAPLSAAFFASEIMYRNRPLLEKLFYSLIAAMTAQAMSSLIAGPRPSMFAVETMVYPPYDKVRYWLALVLMGIVIPLTYQSLAVNHKVPHCPMMPVLVILGGVALRFVIVQAGQHSHWMAAGL